MIVTFAERLQGNLHTIGYWWICNRRGKEGGREGGVGIREDVIVGGGVG